MSTTKTHFTFRVAMLPLRPPKPQMRVEADVGTGVSAKTVGELRKVTTWSESLVITTPQERHRESAVKISKASVATRTSPKL
jgi:hypothetical protein